MADKPLTLEDLQKATGPVGEPDQQPAPAPKQYHPYGDDDYGKGSGHALNKLGGGKPIKPGSGM